MPGKTPCLHGINGTDLHLQWLHEIGQLPVLQLLLLHLFHLLQLLFPLGDLYRIVGTREESSNEEEAEDAGDINMEEGNLNPFPRFGTSFGAGTSEVGPSFQGASNLSNDEVLARMMSQMDMFDTRLNGMESIIADHFQPIEIMHGSLDSRTDTMQGPYQRIASQLQTVIQLLQPHPPPSPED
ncbi:hypothetical protein JCGZ_10447 [Jatropha curcas]|uniref:Uncharacterized protein n=1 Tax=Jatropha curcas TaxID=180498 RepID=A0A067KID2_JATCU|nr:hypothetical protein JCGZ_10447 [Jatropha curcas]